eukprot:COSAG02_NODE_59191_length_275_cov_0.579545_1_plen_91_part_11
MTGTTTAAHTLQPIQVESGGASLDINGDAYMDAVGHLSLTASSASSALDNANVIARGDVQLAAGLSVRMSGKRAQTMFASDVSVLGGDMRV